MAGYAANLTLVRAAYTRADVYALVVSDKRNPDEKETESIARLAHGLAETASAWLEGRIYQLNLWVAKDECLPAIREALDDGDWPDVLENYEWADGIGGIVGDYSDNSTIEYYLPDMIQAVMDKG
jgi:hypothetical protein